MAIREPMGDKLNEEKGESERNEEYSTHTRSF